MPPLPSFDAIRNLIAENNIDGALEALSEHAASSVSRNDLVNLRRRWTEILRKEESNSEHGHILAVEKSRLTGDLLSYVDRLESAPPATAQSPAKKSLSPGKIVIGAASFLLLAIIVIWGIRDGQPTPATPDNDITQTNTEGKEDDAPEEKTDPTGKKIYDDLLTFEDESSEYFMKNTDDREIAVAVYFTEGLGFGEFSESFTRQVIKFADWEGRATATGFKRKFHESSLVSKMYFDGLDKVPELPSFFPKNCPYDVIVIININGDLEYMPAEVGIAAWDVKEGSPITSVYTRNYRRIMGDDGTLDPGEEFYNTLNTVGTLISQR